MKTLGVDLASQPAKTAWALVDWSNGLPRVERLVLGGTDDTIIEMATTADVTGIDAPFGWPTGFTALLTSRVEDAPWTHAQRDRLRFRRTDFHVRSVLGRWPLSVSSDRLALAAMRCQGLLRRLDVEDRSGDGRVFEVYPALALHRWGLPSTGYKGSNDEARRELWGALANRAKWLSISDAQLELVWRSDDALDAIVAALVARAAMLGEVEPVPEADREDARVEGWIAVPRLGSLDSPPA